MVKVKGFLSDLAGYPLSSEEKPNLIDLTIGDTKYSLPEGVREGMKSCVDLYEGGYSDDEQDNDLIKKIRNFYSGKNIDLSDKDIYLTNGAKNESGTIIQLFDRPKVFLPDPTYPAYKFSLDCLGVEDINYFNLVEENDFSVDLKDFVGENTKDSVVVYICNPNNPTGTSLDRNNLKSLVDCVNEKGHLIVYDSAYSGFIRDSSIPYSIFEVPGAEECAVEICSFSKNFGFTGIRLGYTIIPVNLKDSNNTKLSEVWKKWTDSFHNPPSRISKAGGIACFGKKSLQKSLEINEVYLDNAKKLKEVFVEKNYLVFGGENIPYLWVKVPRNASDKDFVFYVKDKTNVVLTSGSSFGVNGKGYVRVSCFEKKEVITEVIERLQNI